MNKTLTQVEFSEDDFARAEHMAWHLGYTQTAYTSSPALIGLFCLPDHANPRRGCVIKTKELGFLFVQDAADIGIE